MSKKKIKKVLDVYSLRAKTKSMYTNKYYNLFMSSRKWTGLTSQQENYVMKKFWTEGTVAAFKIKLLDELGFASYMTNTYNMYDFPEQVELLNTRNVPVIPSGTQINNKDVVIGFINESHDSVKRVVEYYVDRIVEIDMVINTNLQTHKLPFLVGVGPDDIDRANDIIERILNDEPVIFMDSEDINLVKSLATNTPYILDKLYQHKLNLENELLTYLGIDNAGSFDGMNRVNVDQVNANNTLINAFDKAVQECLDEWCDDIASYLGITISCESTLEEVASIHQGGNKNASEDDLEEDEDNE